MSSDPYNRKDLDKHVTNKEHTRVLRGLKIFCLLLPRTQNLNPPRPAPTWIWEILPTFVPAHF